MTSCKKGSGYSRYISVCSVMCLFAYSTDLCPLPLPHYAIQLVLMVVTLQLVHRSEHGRMGLSRSWRGGLHIIQAPGLAAACSMLGDVVSLLIEGTTQFI